MEMEICICTQKKMQNPSICRMRINLLFFYECHCWKSLTSWCLEIIIRLNLNLRNFPHIRNGRHKKFHGSSNFMIIETKSNLEEKKQFASTYTALIHIKADGLCVKKTKAQYHPLLYGRPCIIATPLSSSWSYTMHRSLHGLIDRFKFKHFGNVVK